MEPSYTSLRQLDHHDDSPIRIYFNEQTDDYPAHWHRTYEIIMPVEETYGVTVDGVDYEILPGEMLVIPSGVVHEIFAPDRGTRYILMVDQEVLYGVDGLMSLQHLFYPCVYLRPGTDGGMLEAGRELLWDAIHEGQAGDILNRGAVVAYVSLFLIRLGRWLTQRKSGAGSEHRHRMSEVFLDVCAYIAEHCSEKLTLEDMAAYSGYSKYHFARVFKENAGMSFYEFYMRQRILLCRQLLSEMNKPITEVALRSGFGSIATFNRVFRQYEGVSPTRYRQMRQILLPQR